MKKQRLLALLAACLIAFASVPSLSQASAEDDDLRALMENGVYRPADVGYPAMESYDFPYMGVSFTLPKPLLDALEAKTLYMTQQEGARSDAGELTYGTVTWLAMTQADAETELSLLEGDFGAWLSGLKMQAVLGAYHTELLGELDRLSGLTRHEKLGESADGKVHYYLSLADDMDEETLRLFREINVTYTEILPYPDSCGVEGLPGDPVADFAWETEKEN